MKTYPNLEVQGSDTSSNPNLYQVEPRNLGSCLVESLTGYLIRLAKQHQVIPKVLVQKTIRWEFDTSESLGSVYGKAYAANGFGELSEKWTRLFQRETGQSNLGKLTLLDLKDVCSKRHLLREQKAWCPDCLTHWLSEGKELHEPLIWCLEPVKVCPRHDVPLKTNCPSCEQSVPMITGRSRIGICSHCEKWLGQKSRNESNHDNWESWITDQVVVLIEYLQSATNLKSDLVSKRIKSVLDSHENITITGLAQRMNLKKNTVWYWSKGKTKPTLRNMLKLSYVLGVTIRQFLSGEFVTEELKLQEWRQDDQLERKEPTSVNEDDLEQKLKNALDSTNDPPSLWQVARNTPHQPRILREHFPELCREISKKFQESRHQEFKEKKRKVQKKVREVVGSFHQRGIYPSKPKLEKELSDPGYLNLPEIRQAWKDSLQERGYAV